MMSASSFGGPGREVDALGRLGRSITPAASFEPISLKFYAGSILLVLLALASFAGAAAQRRLLPFAAIGAALLLAPAYHFVRRARSRGSVEGFERGIALRLGGRVHAFPFDELLGLTLSQEEQLNNGTRVGVLRRAVLRSAEATRAFEAIALDGQKDPVGPVLGMLLRGAVDAALRGIQGGRPLAGKGWRLDVQGLSTGRATVPLQEVTSAAIYQRRVSLWRGSEEEPFFSVPEASENALVLHDVVRRRLEQKGDRPRRDSAGLGRVLFENSTGKVMIGAMGFLGLSAFFGGALLLPSEERVAGFISIGVGLLFLAIGFVLMRTRFRVHELGIVQDTLLGRRSVRYADIERLAYSATRHYRNGVYTGTSLEMKCLATGTKPISVSTHTRGTEADLDSLRDHVAGLVSQRLEATLAKDGDVAWAGPLRLTAKGVRFTRSRMFGKGEDVFRPWHELRYSIQGGYFHLFEPDQKKATLSVACASENFFPGFLVFRRLGGFT